MCMDLLTLYLTLKCTFYHSINDLCTVSFIFQAEMTLPQNEEIIIKEPIENVGS